VGVTVSALRVGTPRPTIQTYISRVQKSGCRPKYELESGVKEGGNGGRDQETTRTVSDKVICAAKKRNCIREKGEQLRAHGPGVVES